VTSSVTRLALSPPMDFLSYASLWQQGQRVEPQALRLAHHGGVGTQPEYHARSPHQGEHSFFFRKTFKAQRGIATQHTTSYEAIIPHPA
jgi:hypothetical protein